MPHEMAVGKSRGPKRVAPPRFPQGACGAPEDCRPAQSLAHIALVVRDYDDAIAWFTEKHGFTLVADEPQPEQDKPGAISTEGGSEIATSKRWVLVAPPGAGEGATTILLARA